MGAVAWGLWPTPRFLSPGPPETVTPSLRSRGPLRRPSRDPVRRGRRSPRRERWPWKEWYPSRTVSGVNRINRLLRQRRGRHRPNAFGRPANGAKRPPIGFKLASAGETSLALGYAPADSEKNLGPGSLNSVMPKDDGVPADIDTSRTAIYDIASRTVYLPNGRRLEAHSGLGGQMDDARYVSRKMTGPTPPNVYDLRMRESLFHGVRAIRLIPQDDSKMYGRDGILAHTYMLGPNGQSNGCVSFRDYDAFLDAFLRGDITRIVVVERLAGVPSSKTASDWLPDALKNLFRKS
jgi:hypothetical protein